MSNNKRHAYVLRVDQPPAPDRTFDCELANLNAFVAGWIELVRVDLRYIWSLQKAHDLDFLRDAPPGSQVFLVVNEEGTLMGLPFNAAASELAGRPIVGNAVLCALD